MNAVAEASPAPGAPPSRPAIEARSLYRFFRAGDKETLALQGVTLSAAAGEVIAVVGPSGSGKSTLLACLAGIDEPDGGSVTIAGRRMSHQPEPARARIRAQMAGMLFQNGNLFDHLSVEANVALASTSPTGPCARAPSTCSRVAGAARAARRPVRHVSRLF